MNDSEFLQIKIENEKIIIEKPNENKAMSQLEERNYLTIVEALWLVYSKNKKLVYNNRILKVEDLLKIARNDFVWIVFTVYNDLRNRGKKVEVLGDNLLLMRTDAKDIDVYVLEENNLVSLNRLIELIEISHRRGREVVFALVDKHGDVTYYSTSPITL